MTQPWFSHRDDGAEPSDFCLVCFAYGGVVIRHRPRPVDVPKQERVSETVRATVLA